MLQLGEILGLAINSRFAQGGISDHPGAPQNIAEVLTWIGRRTLLRGPLLQHSATCGDASSEACKYLYVNMLDEWSNIFRLECSTE